MHFPAKRVLIEKDDLEKPTRLIPGRLLHGAVVSTSATGKIATENAELNPFEVLLRNTRTHIPGNCVDGRRHDSGQAGSQLYVSSRRQLCVFLTPMPSAILSEVWTGVYT